MKEDKKEIRIKFSTAILTYTIIVILMIAIIVVTLLKLKNPEEERLESNTEINNINQDIQTTDTTEETTNNKNSIKIRFAYSYGISTADALNEMENELYGENYIDILEIQLEGDNLAEINGILENTSFEKTDFSMSEGTDLAIGVEGEFELTINNDITLLLDQTWSLYTKEESYIIKTPEELFNKIATIVQEEIDKNSKNYSSEKITITSKNLEDEDIIITDEDDINMLIENLKYAKVNMHKEEMEDETVTYIVDLNNGVQIYVFNASKIGYIVDNTEEYYITFINDFENIISELYESY